MSYDDAHSAVAVGLAERFLEQPADMAWEQRCDELATAAIEAMQIFISVRRDASAIEARSDAAPKSDDHD